MGSIRVALVNDQPLFARGLQLLLPAVTESRVTIVATTDDGSLASGMVRQHRPDVVVVDLAIAAPGGLRTIAAIKRTQPEVPVIAMSDRDGQQHGGELPAGADQDSSPRQARVAEAIEALDAGAIGYLCKTTEPEDLIPPLLAAVDGWAVIPPDVIVALLARQPATSATPLLDDQERRLWRLIASGFSVEQIALDLHVSDRTAKRLTAALLRRLNVRTRIEAATLAGRMGLLDSAAD